MVSGLAGAVGCCCIGGGTGFTSSSVVSTAVVLAAGDRPRKTRDRPDILVTDQTVVTDQ